MIARRLALTASALALIGAAGCGGQDSKGSMGASATEPDSTGTGAAAAAEGGAGQPTATGITVKVADSDYGKILFDGKDQAIYLFDKETSDTSECYEACAEAWPPVLSKGPPQAGSGAAAARLGTTERRDGSSQVTYKGHPLYYYNEDPPGEVLCHNVDEFGGLWLVVEPSGDPVSG